MATTTIRIEDDLKMRVSAAAEIAGKTPHAFILDAISATVEQVELDAEFDAIAERRWATIVATGKTVPWEAAREHLLARSRGERPRRPAAQKPTS
jgi:predicted transcriptional regulator